MMTAKWTQMLHRMNKVKISALNTNGFRGNYLYIDEITKQYDITFISEHWLISDQIYLLNKIIHNKIIHVNPAEDTRGRPSGGTAWIIHEQLDTHCKYLSHGKHFSEIEINMNGTKYCLIGVYLLYNDNTKEQLNAQRDLLWQLSSIVNAKKRE